MLKIKGVNIVFFLYDWSGWWVKLEFFNLLYFVFGNEDIFYIDIDSVVVGDIIFLIIMKKIILFNDFF